VSTREHPLPQLPPPPYPAMPLFAFAAASLSAPALRATGALQSTAFLAPASTRRPPSLTPRRRCALRAAAAPPPADAPLSPLETAAVALALPSLAVVGVSEATLLGSGCGLPPGPGGSLGAAEGVGYLVVAGLVVWSAVRKFRTGSGLRPGPGGVLGAVEGLAWLAALVGVSAAGYVAWRYGGLPNPVPATGSRCFPVE
jgi:hypothetical protein